ncbi:MAG: hypothetical protein KGS47_07825, partial [Chloroflexi bacterium]|nr:hypothetical protein [Chloroflexota bacterium]
MPDRRPACHPAAVGMPGRLPTAHSSSSRRGSPRAAVAPRATEAALTPRAAVAPWSTEATLAPRAIVAPWSTEATLAPWAIVAPWSTEATLAPRAIVAPWSTEATLAPWATVAALTPRAAVATLARWIEHGHCISHVAWQPRPGQDDDPCHAGSPPCLPPGRRRHARAPANCSLFVVAP